MLFAQALVVLLHILVVVLAFRFALRERLSAMSRFRRDVETGRFSIARFINVEDERKGYRREMVEGLTDSAHFTFLMVHDNRNGLCEFNLRVNDQYYGAWFAREDGGTRLARLYRRLRPAS